jgi:spore coat protein U-like protein
MRLLFALFALGGAAGVHAAASCAVTAIGPAFGTYDPSNPSPTVVNGSLTATCTWTGGGSTTVSLVSSFSPGNSGGYPNRFMLSGTNQLAYNIYFDAAFTSVRGNGSSGTATGGPATLTVSSARPSASTGGTLYGRIPAGQNAVPGSYLDTIVVTITY